MYAKKTPGIVLDKFFLLFFFVLLLLEGDKYYVADIQFYKVRIHCQLHRILLDHGPGGASRK